MKSSPVWALGAMSGTSLDGVDAAMVLTDGIQVFEFGETAFRPYSEEERAALRAALGHVEGAECMAATEVVEIAHTEVLSGFDEADLIGFHGQTVLHQPDKGRTVQLGNGQVLAEALGRPVVWDFRTADVELGGEGAPLAPFYHFALARYLGRTAPVAFVNIGGVANVTWVDPRLAAAESPGACLAFDTGPGNALIDDLCKARLGQPMDIDGTLSQSGVVDETALTAMLAHRYFNVVPPKSLDRNDFHSWLSVVAELDDADAVATLAAGTARAIAMGLDHCPAPPVEILVTGGGRKNLGIMSALSDAVSCPVVSVEAHGLDGDMLEAQAFAYLAVRVQRGLPTSAPGTTGVSAPVGGGQISHPRHLSQRKINA